MGACASFAPFSRLTVRVELAKFEELLQLQPVQEKLGAACHQGVGCGWLSVGTGGSVIRLRWRKKEHLYVTVQREGSRSVQK